MRIFDGINKANPFMLAIEIPEICQSFFLAFYYGQHRAKAPDLCFITAQH